MDHIINFIGTCKHAQISMKPHNRPEITHTTVLVHISFPLLFPVELYIQANTYHLACLWFEDSLRVSNVRMTSLWSQEFLLYACFVVKFQILLFMRKKIDSIFWIMCCNSFFFPFACSRVNILCLVHMYQFDVQ